MELEVLCERFGRALRRRREALGVSQERLAFDAQLHRTYIGLLERGQRNPTLAIISRLADALGTTMTSLVRETETGRRR